MNKFKFLFRICGYFQTRTLFLNMFIDMLKKRKKWIVLTTDGPTTPQEFLTNFRTSVLLPLPVQNLFSKHILSNVKTRVFQLSISEHLWKLFMWLYKMVDLEKPWCHKKYQYHETTSKLSDDKLTLLEESTWPATENIYRSGRDWGCQVTTNEPRQCREEMSVLFPPH